MFSCLRMMEFKKTGVTSVICHSPLFRLERLVAKRIRLNIRKKVVLAGHVVKNTNKK